MSRIFDAHPAGRFPDIVGADQEDNYLGADPLECAVLDAPEDVLRLIASNADVVRPVLAEVVLEDLPLRICTPVIRDGVADEDQLGAASPDELFLSRQDLLVTLAILLSGKAASPFERAGSAATRIRKTDIRPQDAGQQDDDD